jgi:hypothetical protein
VHCTRRKDGTALSNQRSTRDNRLHIFFHSDLSVYQCVTYVKANNEREQAKFKEQFLRDSCADLNTCMNRFVQLVLQGGLSARESKEVEFFLSKKVHRSESIH